MAKSGNLETKRLILEPFSGRFLTERYVSWLNDPEVVRFSEQRWRKHTLESCREYMDSFDGTPHHFWAVVSRFPEEGHIGNMNSTIDTRNRVADIGILIGEKRVWGRGYGSEAFLRVADYLFRHEGIRKITAGTLAANKGMMKIMERAGMKEDGRRVRQVLLEGREEDTVYRALFREDWQGEK